MAQNNQFNRSMVVEDTVFSLVQIGPSLSNDKMTFKPKKRSKRTYHEFNTNKENDEPNLASPPFELPKKVEAKTKAP